MPFETGSIKPSAALAAMAASTALPPRLQDIEPDLRRQRDTRANHPVTRHNFRASRERLAGDAIDLAEERRDCEGKRDKKGKSAHAAT